MKTVWRLAALLAPALMAFGKTKVPAEREAAIKADLAGQIDGMKKQAQVMVDSVFSFGELGFQEFETSKYLAGVLEKEGFTIERGVAGIPTAWIASWGRGKPVISLGSDIDDIPQASNNGQRVDSVRQPAHRRGHVREHQKSRTAAMVGSGSDARQGNSKRTEGPGRGDAAEIIGDASAARRTGR
jgi:hypothetical protein